MTMHRKILIAADDAAFLREAALALTGRGYAIIPVGDADGALAFARRERVDLLVIDAHMGCAAGCAILDAVVADPALASTPTIFLTRDRTGAAVASVARHNDAAVLYQPMDMADLVTAVTRSMPDAEGRAA